MVLRLVVTSLIVLLAVQPAAARESSIQLAIDAPFADPSFLVVDGHFYAYATGGDGADGGFPVASADSMTGPWTVHETVSMPEKPDWVGQNPQGAYNYWAPSVFRNSAGTFVMYFTANNDATDRRCIGVATAEDPLGPFTAQPDPLQCHDEGQVIDTTPFGADGQRYVVYKVKVPVTDELKSFQIRIQKMDSAGEHPVQGDRTLLEHTGPEEETIEAPDIRRHGDGFFLFVARDRFGSCDYRTEVWRADRLWTDEWTVAATLLDTVNTDICGPGGTEVGRVGDADWIVFHGWRDNLTYRAMYVARIGWSADAPYVL